MQNKLSELKKSYEERGWPKIAVGLGLSTGDMTVGDMGSNIRKAYTVMGDAVNLGSRLEGITRQYGVGILVSEETQKESEGIIYRDIDMVRVKGKDNPITIFEPVDLESAINPQTRSQVDQWNILIQHYRAQKWDEADTILRTLLASDPDRKLYQVYAERITLFRQDPPPSNWDGVTKFETK
jgi:adenylate cyclase